ncbi:20735_t:CDS:1, partial [Gigaspora margarita]
EQELRKKLKSIIEFNSEINDLNNKLHDEIKILFQGKKGGLSYPESS